MSGRGAALMTPRSMGSGHSRCIRKAAARFPPDRGWAVLMPASQGNRCLEWRKGGHVTPPTPAPTIDYDTRRQLAASLFNRVWTLLDTQDRTPEQDDEMVHAAHASRYHWGELETGARLARGEWQCSRVYAVLGRAEPALHHAQRCLAICEAEGIGDFDLAFANEALARASHVAGRPEDTREYVALARR